MEEKNPAGLLRECLEQIDKDLGTAECEIVAGNKNFALNKIAKARGRIGNFLVIMGYLRRND